MIDWGSRLGKERSYERLIIAVFTVALLGAALIYVYTQSGRPDWNPVPYGDFGDMELISSNKSIVRVASFDSNDADAVITKYRVVIDPPGNVSLAGSQHGWNLSDGLISVYNSSLVFSFVDHNLDGRVNEGDYIEIESTARLANGEWVLNLIFRDTGYAIIEKSFAI